MNAPNENVLVIRRELFDQLGSFQGLNFEPQKYLGAFLSRGNNCEQRLVAKGSIGIGGHMNETDESLFAMDEQAYRAGVEREVNEEINIATAFEDRIVALLNDETTEVGRVHLGIVHVFKLAEPKVEKREAMITGLTFLAKDELLARRESMETWSQICLDSLDRLLL